jgi:hypothetical protein
MASKQTMNHRPSLHTHFKQWVFSLTVFLGIATSPVFASNAMRGVVDSVITDRISGIAIMGYDPVAYFTNKEAIQGSPQYETVWQGVVWRFANKANQAVFESAPNIYTPAFGGYDPIGKSRGRNVTGNPHIFAVKNNQVYFFYNQENRDLFFLPTTAMKNRD